MSPTRVLIVDDHAIFRQGLRKLFDEHSEFTVVGEAASGAEAVVAVKQLTPDILLLDLQLGDMTGLDVLRRLGARIDVTDTSGGAAGEPMGTLVVRHGGLRDTQVTPE